MSNAELARRLLELAAEADGGEPKTGRRYYYLALSHGLIRPDMSDSAEAKRSRDAAYKRVTKILANLRKAGRLGWEMVLDLTRDISTPLTYASCREARASLRRIYDEDRWQRQKYFPVLVVEKDTMEPICQPIADHWQMLFASSRGYGSLKLQHDLAKRLNDRYAHTKQPAIIYFISDLDPSGLDLQRAWQATMDNFGVTCIFIRIALNPDQVHEFEHLSIEVKPSDSRSKGYIAEHGDRCWEVDVLPASVIEDAIESNILTWLDERDWEQREREIEVARKLL
jgi:hypothetical protein